MYIKADYYSITVTYRGTAISSGTECTVGIEPLLKMIQETTTE